MRVFVLTRKTMFIYAAAAFAAIAAFAAAKGAYGAVTASATPKEIPIYCVDTEKKEIALTFDAAWGDNDTDEIISVLKENDAKASFFAVGGFIKRFPESVKKFHDNGHEILNHSDSHAHMSGLTEEQVKEELDGCEKKIANTVGESKKLFRPPYGEYNDNVIKYARNAGYTAVQWDVDSLDWKDLSADEIYRRVVGKTKNGSIILFHNGAKNTPEALKTILPALKKQGFKFVTVSELIYKKDYTIDNSGRQKKSGK